MWVLQIEDGRYLIHCYDGSYFTIDIHQARIFRDLKEAESICDRNSLAYPPLSEFKSLKVVEVELKVKGGG